MHAKCEHLLNLVDATKGHSRSPRPQKNVHNFSLE